MCKSLALVCHISKWNLICPGFHYFFFVQKKKSLQTESHQIVFCEVCNRMQISSSYSLHLRVSTIPPINVWESGFCGYKTTLYILPSNAIIKRKAKQKRTKNSNDKHPICYTFVVLLDELRQKLESCVSLFFFFKNIKFVLSPEHFSTIGHN